MDYEKITEKIRKFTKKHVKESRYEHSVRVAETCQKLCLLYGLDEKKGYLAGIAHDMCKDFPEKKLFSLVKKDGKTLTKLEKSHSALLHGRAAAVLLQKKFGIKDPDILQAVANHTSAAMNCCDLTKCLFLADKIEPGRPQSTDEYRENLYKLTLPQIFYSVLKENYEYMVNKGFEIEEETLKMLDFYKVDLPN